MSCRLDPGVVRKKEKRKKKTKKKTEIVCVAMASRGYHVLTVALL